MTEAVGAVAGGMSVERYELVEFGALQNRLQPFAPVGGRGELPIQGLGQSLAEELKATSDSYRRALARAVDPLSPSLFEGAGSATAAPVAGPGAGFGPGAAAEPTAIGVETPVTEQAVAPAAAEELSGAGGDQSGFAGTDAAVTESIELMMRAHSEIMKRQIGVMSATATLEASVSGARSTGQNIDTLLRGA